MKVCSKQRERESLPEYTALEHSITERQQKDQTVIITFMQTRPDCHHNILQPLRTGRAMAGMPTSRSRTQHFLL